MKQPFAKGLIVGGAIVNAMTVTKGRFPGGHWATHRDAESPLLLTDRDERYPKPDGKYTFDKLSGVFLTGNATRDDAPSHIRVAEAGAARGRRGVAVDVPGRRLRGARGRSGERPGRPDREPVELRAVRRDHRQGRAPDAARGRRRPAVPDHRGTLRGIERPPQLGGRSRVSGTRCLVACSSPSCCSSPSPPRRRRSRPRARCSSPASAGSTSPSAPAVFEGQMRTVAGARADADALHAAGPHARAGPLDAASAPRASGAGSARRRARRATSTPSASRTCSRPRPTGCCCASAGSTPTATSWSAQGRTRRAARQPDPRPNLVVQVDRRRAGRPPARRRYVVFVRNTGGSTRGRDVARSAQPRRACRCRRRRSRRSSPARASLVTVDGPACAAGAPRGGGRGRRRRRRRAQRGRQPSFSRACPSGAASR